jgi:glycosyltransferase involved in cell wall biosynthesis
MRVLFLTVHRPDRSPSQRFRFEQYLGYLRAQGIECEHSWLLDAEQDRAYYGANLRRKFQAAAQATFVRLGELLTLKTRRFDVLFVQREAYFAGPAWFELAGQSLGSKLVFDFDDSIWVHQVSESNRAFGWLKVAEKTDTLIRRADLVLAGNAYLADHARGLSRRVKIVPTTIDTELYRPRAMPRSASEPVCVGWSGSLTTIEHFQVALPALRRVKARFGDRVRFKVIGDPAYSEPSLGIVGERWRLDSEIQDLHDIDIGLMPLPDTEWARGKCGLKGLQYMALGIPTLMSPVGVNAQIIQDGQNGFLPRSEDEWVARIGTLVEDAGVRASLGQAGRRTVEEHYSVAAWRNEYAQILSSLARG